MPNIENPENPVPDRGVAAGPSSLRRRWLLNGALLILIGVLVWLAVHRAGLEKKVSSPPLTALTTEAVSKLRIQRPDQPAIVLEKSGTFWTLSKPVPARANPFNVESLLRVISAPGDTRFSAKAGELAKFGLDKPQSRLWLNDQEIAFGSLHPLNNRIYVLYQNEVVLIPGHYLGPVLYPYPNFIDSRLFEENRKLTSIGLPDFTLSLENGAWQKNPPDSKLTSDRMNDFAAEWQNARALGVEKYSGKPVLDRITIASTHEAKNEKLVLGILAYKPSFVLLRPEENLEYHFTEETGKRLLSLSPGNE